MGNSTCTYTGDEVLHIMSHCAINRNNAIEKLLRTCFDLGSLVHPKKILEFGAGRGEFINRFIRDDHLETYAIELDEHYLSTLAQHHRVFTHIECIDEPVDFIYLIDVLEHIKADEQLLQRLYAKLNAGGKLFIYVPARMELYSLFDATIGHYRRYHKKELAQKIENAQFIIETIRYHELLGYIAAYYNRLWAKNGVLNPAMVRIYDKLFVPVTTILERVLRVPIGKSLYALATKCNNTRHCYTQPCQGSEPDRV